MTSSSLDLITYKIRIISHRRSVEFVDNWERSTCREASLLLNTEEST